MTDIATRIREKLDCDHAWRHTPGRWPGYEAEVDGPEVTAEADAYAGAIRAVLDLCDRISRTHQGEPYYPGMAFAHEFRDVIAKALRIADSPAVQAGSQPDGES